MKLGEYLGSLIIDSEQYTVDVTLGKNPRVDSHVTFTFKEEPPFVPNFHRMITKELLDQEMIDFRVSSDKLEVNIKPVKFGITIPTI